MTLIHPQSRNDDIICTTWSHRSVLNLQIPVRTICDPSSTTVTTTRITSQVDGKSWLWLMVSRLHPQDPTRTKRLWTWKSGRVSRATVNPTITLTDVIAMTITTITTTIWGENPTTTIQGYAKWWKNWPQDQLQRGFWWAPLSPRPTSRSQVTATAKRWPSVWKSMEWCIRVSWLPRPTPMQTFDGSILWDQSTN